MRRILNINGKEYILFENGIYQHYKGDFYKLLLISFDRDDQNKAIVIYNKCDENGVFKSIRNKNKEYEEIIRQPFYADIDVFTEIVPSFNNEYVQRFKLIKIL